MRPHTCRWMPVSGLYEHCTGGLCVVTTCMLTTPCCSRSDNDGLNIAHPSTHQIVWQLEKVSQSRSIWVSKGRSVSVQVNTRAQLGRWAL